MKILRSSYLPARWVQSVTVIVECRSSKQIVTTNFWDVFSRSCEIQEFKVTAMIMFTNTCIAKMVEWKLWSGRLVPYQANEKPHTMIKRSPPLFPVMLFCQNSGINLYIQDWKLWVWLHQISEVLDSLQGFLDFCTLVSFVVPLLAIWTEDWKHWLSGSGTYLNHQKSQGGATTCRTEVYGFCIFLWFFCEFSWETNPSLPHPTLTKIPRLIALKFKCLCQR